ncbi:MAG: phosphotransferase [Thiotrichales bacterium]
MSIDHTPATLLPDHPIANASALPLRFEDSSNQLWMLELENGSKQVLRVRQSNAETAGPFWPGLRALCNLQPDTHLAGISQLQQRIAKLTPLHIPEVIKSQPATQTLPAWVLSTYVPGDVKEQITHQDTARLAQHLAAMHDETHSVWGNPLALEYFPAEHWKERIHSAIDALVRNYWNQNKQVSFYHKAHTIMHCSTPKESTFSWVLADLRWDQFLWSQGRLNALVDFEAHLIAPKALDFITLEYLLDPEQAQVFAEQYRKAGGTLPELKAVRNLYRFFYFLLGILGETDLERWMAHPEVF